MQDVGADIWILTESRETVSPGEGFTLVARSGRDGAEQDGECWVAIWSRVGGAQLPTSDQDRSAALELGAGSSQPLVVFGTVLPWLGSPWRDAPASNGRAFTQSLALQVADWRRFKTADPSRHLCVAGDFNQDLLRVGHYYGSKIGRASLRAALADEALMCPTADPDDAVWHHTNGKASGIDHICISDRLSASPATVRVWPAPSALGSALTDHFGVCITVAAS